MLWPINDREFALIKEALAMAASRHEALGNATKSRFRWDHDDKARRMRDLRQRLIRELERKRQ